MYKEISASTGTLEWNNNENCVVAISTGRTSKCHFSLTIGLISSGAYANIDVRSRHTLAVKFVSKTLTASHIVKVK